MERLENLTIEKLEVASKLAETVGYQDSKSFENVPAGTCSAHPVIISVDGKITPAFALIKFERIDEKTKAEIKLKFEAVKLDVLHVSSGKKFNGIYAKVTPELKQTLINPENYTKELIMESQEYKGRTFLKFESMSK